MSLIQQSQRRHDLDWIRVLATLAVFLYHCSMFFNPYPWHVKNNVINTTYIYAFSLFLSNWIMPVFFAVSGISVSYALQKRTGTSFLKERLARLGIPLLLGAFILSPPQVYMQRVSHHQFSGSFLQFLPHYFDGVYVDIDGTGNFAFEGLHLWYLLVLLLFSLITLPFILRKRQSAEMRSFTWKHYFLLLLPFFVLAVALNGFVNVGGWGLCVYLCLYLYGSSFFKTDRARNFIKNNGVTTGILAIVSSIGFVVWGLYGFPANGTLASLFFTLTRVFNVWNWLLFIFYLGEKYLMRSNRVLKYTSAASMPFYVIHQPVIVTLAFLLYTLDWAVPVKLVLLVPSAFLIIMVLYHFLIQRFDWLRVLFGMRKKSTSETSNKLPPIADSSVRNG